jgi:hypothetical protein
MIKCKDCKHFEEKKLGGQTYYECLKIWNVTIYDKDFEHLCNFYEKLVNGDSTSHDKALNIAVVMPSFLNELAEKHNVDVNKLVVGMQFGDIQVWRYDTGANEVWKTLEIIPKN